RRDTLATFAACERALDSLKVPYTRELNPPLWELGHIGWFQNFWVARNPVAERLRGRRADPLAPRLVQAPGHRAEADALYDSTRVAHATRWQLSLPDAQATRRDLALGLAATLELLETLAKGASAATAPGLPQGIEPGGLRDSAKEGAQDHAQDDALYFFRLALVHEDMHHEAALYMAQALGVPVDDPRWQPRTLPEPPPALPVPGDGWCSTRPGAAGFCFDNELGELRQEVPAFEIDAQAVRWAVFLPCVEAGGYELVRWWTPAGWAWCQASVPSRADRRDSSGQRGAAAPRYLRREGGAWQVWRQGQWRALDLAEPACHLTLHEAQAWCAWAGRRLPTEFEWERAALTQPQAFAWGDVWEWTASPFAAFPGFEPHPYREYSAPWFDGRPVLKGASFMTQPRMRHPRYRNFFEAHRNDVPAGFRSCAGRTA
ncbi:MAG: SUMF1/EgtB/PvdO family nonheme iron enzyme, partial [Rubrivivax sp.]